MNLCPAAPERSAISTAANSAQIRLLNDALRAGRGEGRVVVTAGIAMLIEDEQIVLLKSVRGFDAFEDANDPYGEHDFGSVLVGDDSYFWKIDYYDRYLTSGSPNPADPIVTCRVLTIMRADEY